MTYKNVINFSIGFILHFFSSLVTADILDGGEVRFHGLVIDNGPRWTWQVASTDQSWLVDTADARTETDRLIFNLTNQGHFPFLEGRLHEVVGTGGPGFSPQITFSSDGNSFLLPDGGNSTHGRFRAGVPVVNPENGKVVGLLTFTLEQGLAATFSGQSGTGSSAGMFLLTGGVVTQLPSDGLSQRLMERLSSLLLMTPGWGSGMSAVSRGQTLPQSLLSRESIKDIAVSYSSFLSDFQLTLPVADTPAYWQARVSVTVTVQ